MRLDPDLDAVVLDAGGVLLIPDPEAFRKHLAPFGLAPDDDACHRAHYVGLAEVDRLGVADFASADRAIARFLGADDEVLDDATHAVTVVFRSEPWVPVAGAAEALLRLQQAGLALAVVSNAQGTVAEQLEAHRICSVRGGDAATVTIVVDSHLVGIEKPDPAIFDFALEALGLGPERCVYVGDTVHFDVNGARAAGIRPVHVTYDDLCADTSHAHAASLEAFVDQLLS